MIALTRDQMHSHDVALQSELAADLIVVHGDRVQLQQVILNLIANAIEAMSTIRDRRRQLAIVSANDGGGVRVEVRDCGPGVEPDGAERIFEPFYTTKADGIGMGLWICRSIIEAHGGRLWVTPNPPRGAAFQFSLPGTKAEGGTGGAPRPPAPAFVWIGGAGRPMSALIERLTRIKDNQHFRSILSSCSSEGADA